jgi:hypothetical protein
VGERIGSVAVGGIRMEVGAEVARSPQDAKRQTKRRNKRFFMPPPFTKD